MTTEVESDPQELTEPDTAEEMGIKFAMIFELEQISAKAREMEYDVLKSILDEKNKQMTPTDFSRECLLARPEQYIDALLNRINANKLSSSKLAEDVTSGVAMHLTKGDFTLREGFGNLIEYTKKNDILIAAITALPESVYVPLVEKLAIGADLKVVSFNEVDPHFPRADAFLKVAKELNLPPRHCTAFVSTSSSCKAALTAGMRGVAAPDTYTAFQDFGGAHSVVDSLEDLDLDVVFAAIEI